MYFVDTDILSAFVKVGGIKYLKALFQNLNIAPSIYEELARAKRAGYPYLDDILTEVEIILLSEDEFGDFRNLLENEKDLHEGECKLLALCKSRKGFFITNDKVVKSHCKKNNIDYLDLEDVLRALKLKNILNFEELKKLIEDIEKKDWTIIKAKEDILKD
jgi:predicted nucleic acid-binding protein